MIMPRIRLAVVVLLSCAAVARGQEPAASAPQQNDEVVVAWLRQHAIPLDHVEAGNGFSDLQPLKRIWKDVRIIGLGEATHGTREFQQVKHRLLEFLVTEMDFTAFAMEAAYSDTQPINGFVLHGQGNRAAALTGQGYVAWDTEEFSRMLDWVRAHNQTVPDEKKVRFYGFDMHRNAVGRREVVAYLGRVAPAKVAPTDSLFRVLAELEAKWPRWDTTMVAQTRPGFEDLADFLTVNRESLVGRSSSSEYQRMLRFVEVMKRSVSPGARSNMSDNLMYIIDRERPGTKFVLWAADAHIAKADGIGRSVGATMRRNFGDQYYSVGLDFEKGSYHTRVVPPEGPAGDLKVKVRPPAAPGSLAWYLSRTRLGNLFLDLRAVPGDRVVRDWMSTPLVIRGGGSWAYSETSSERERNITALYDGMIFIETTTPTRPTPNARKAVANKELF